MNIQLVIFDMSGKTIMDKGNINDAFRQSFLTAGSKPVLDYGKGHTIFRIIPDGGAA